ncbi:MAG: hypothetical protein GC159_19005 [Phycisphaera sp.]|nr:hypothetical protein [Phycisphaera sp.]
MDQDETPRDEQFLAVAQILAIGLLRSLNKDELARGIMLPPSIPEFLPHPDPIAEPVARTQPRPATEPSNASPTKRPRRSKNPSDDTIVDLLDPGVDQFIRQRAKQICRRREFSRSDEDDLCQEIRLHVLSLAKPPRTTQLKYTIDMWERRYVG